MPVLRAGTELKHGTFVIHSLLGRGGFGEVYLASQPRMNREVAVKVLSPGVSEETDILKRFEREAMAAGRLRHPNVLPVFDFDYDEDAGVYFLAMQYVPGGLSLLNLMRGRMSPREVTRIITDVASALDAAHALGIVHRDVKPPNVLMDESRRPLLADFGIAHLSELTGMTQKGMAVGTPAFVSPEQGMGKPVGPASDQYSLAVMTYQMLAGRPPFTGDSLSLVMQHVSAVPPPLTTHNPSLPSELAAVVAKALSKNPAERYATCSEFAAALSAAAAGLVSVGTMVMGTPSEVAPAPYLNPTVPPPPPGSAASLGQVAAGGTLVSEAMPAEAGASSAASGVVSDRSVASERAVPAPAPAKLPIPFIAAGVGAVVVLALGGLIAARQMTGSQDAASPSTPVVPVLAFAPTATAEPNVGVVTIDSLPQAVVVLDGVPGARTPRELRLDDDGEHEIKLISPTYEEWTYRVSVAPGQKLDIGRVGLVPLREADIVLSSITDKRLGRDPYVDARDIIRLTTPTDTFRVNEDINALFYLNPKTYGIRDLNLKLRWSFERPGGAPPAEIRGEQKIEKEWEDTFVRGCAPASALDATGTNTPLNVTLFVDDQPVGSMSYRITPGPVSGLSDCDKTVLPRTGLGT